MAGDHYEVHEFTVIPYGLNQKVKSVSTDLRKVSERSLRQWFWRI